MSDERISNNQKNARESFRTKLWDISIKAYDDYDKAILSLSAGALGISVVFIKDIIGAGNLKLTILLGISWISWILSLVSVLISFYFSRRFHEEAIDKMDNEEKCGGRSKCTELFNILSGALFVAGVVCFMIFAFINISRGKGEMNKKIVPSSIMRCDGNQKKRIDEGVSYMPTPPQHKGVSKIPEPPAQPPPNNTGTQAPKVTEPPPPTTPPDKP